jgi:glycosyltransferase involved in cell wall biosynthesis
MITSVAPNLRASRLPIGSHIRLAFYHGLPAGGAKRVAFEQAMRLSERHSLSLFSIGEADSAIFNMRPYAETSLMWDFRPGRLFSSPFGRLNQGVRIADLLRLRGAARKMAVHIDAGRYDLGLVHPCLYSHAPWILHFLRTPSVFYCHENNRLIREPAPFRSYQRDAQWQRALTKIDPLNRLYFALLSMIERTSLASATHVLVNSRYIQQELKRLYNVEAAVCYPAVAIEKFSALGLPRGDFVVSVGGLLPLKGFDFIIEGISRIPERVRPRLLLVHHMAIPEERAYLEMLAERLGVRLEFVYRASEEALVEIYNRALATIYTPVREPFGLVPLESMACETPVIGIAEGGVTETVVDGVTGLLVRREPSELAAAIAEMMERPRLRTEMGRMGRLHVEQEWTWDRSVARLEEHLVTVSRGHSAAAGGEEARS